MKGLALRQAGGDPMVKVGFQDSSVMALWELGQSKSLDILRAEVR